MDKSEHNTSRHPMHQRLFKDHSETVAGMRCSRLMVNLGFLATYHHKGARRWPSGLPSFYWEERQYDNSSACCGLIFKCHWAYVFLFLSSAKKDFDNILWLIK